MIHTRYRDKPFSLLKIANIVGEHMLRDGICFIFGFPNDNIHDYVCRVFGWRDIGELDFYLLARNIGGVLPKLKWLNLISRALAGVLTHLPSWRLRRVNPTNIEKITDETYKERRYGSSHLTIGLDNSAEVTYRIITKENGLKALYIIDVNPLTAAAFDRAVKYVYRNSGKDAEVIIFRGRLPFRPATMIRFPESLLRKYIARQRICGKILDPKIIDDRVFDIDNWNINLSNNDVP